MTLLLLNLGLLWAVLPGMAQTTRGLFIGNSYIGVNDLPEMTQEQSQIPSFPPGQVASVGLPYATAVVLSAAIRLALERSST